VKHIDQMLFATYSFVGGDLNGWDTSRITSMKAVFSHSTAFRGDVSLWDVSRVTTFFEMFSHCSVFDSDLSGWNTSSAINMQEMFDRANAFSSDISSWETREVENMAIMVREERCDIASLRNCSQLTVIIPASAVSSPMSSFLCYSLAKHVLSTLICRGGMCLVCETVPKCSFELCRTTRACARGENISVLRWM
jgi:surface protein